MTKCPACGVEVDGSAHECSGCGAALEGTTQSFAPVESPGDAVTHVQEESVGPSLVVRKGPEVGECFSLDRVRVTIGRDPGSDIFLNDVTVSRAHAVVEVVGREVSISDVGSLNGTYVNGVCVDKAILREGDVVQVGTFQMVFVAGRDG